MSKNSLALRRITAFQRDYLTALLARCTPEQQLVMSAAYPTVPDVKLQDAILLVERTLNAHGLPVDVMRWHDVAEFEA